MSEAHSAPYSRSREQILKAWKEAEREREWFEKYVTEPLKNEVIKLVKENKMKVNGIESEALFPEEIAKIEHVKETEKPKKRKTELGSPVYGRLKKKFVLCAICNKGVNWMEKIVYFPLVDAFTNDPTGYIADISHETCFLKKVQEKTKERMETLQKKN